MARYYSDMVNRRTLAKSAERAAILSENPLYNIARPCPVVRIREVS